MGQNKSSAVMNQRAPAPDDLDDFPTSPWGGRALVEHVIKPLIGHPGGASRGVWEPACNRGFLARGLIDYFGCELYATDVHNYGWARMNAVADFLFASTVAPADMNVNWIITNPPFLLADQFIKKAMTIAETGVAMFTRLNFLEGEERYRELFQHNAPTVIAQFAERVPLFRGMCRDPNKKYWDPEAIDKKTKKKGAWKKPSTATAYCWLVWIKDMPRQPFQWIPPCRRQLERPGDYPVWPEPGSSPPRPNIGPLLDGH